MHSRLSEFQSKRTASDKLLERNPSELQKLIFRKIWLFKPIGAMTSRLGGSKMDPLGTECHNRSTLLYFNNIHIPAVNFLILEVKFLNICWALSRNNEILLIKTSHTFTSILTITISNKTKPN